MIPITRLPKLGLQASNAERWTTCTASPGMILAHHDVIEETTSAAAEEGTIAHLRAAEAILLGFDKASFGKNREMAGYVEDYTNYINGHRAKGSRLMVEQNIKLFYMVDRNGFIDILILKRKGLTIIDFKYGRGISVPAEKNKQMMIYARSMIDHLERLGIRTFRDDEVVELVIWQPRIFAEEAERYWSITVGELRAFTDEIGGIAHAIQKSPHKGKHIKFAPSDKACQFCPLAEHALCGACTAWILGGLPADPGSLLASPEDGIELPVAELLSVAEITSLLRNKDQIMKLFERAENRVFRDLRAGGESDDWKLVAGRSTRKWKDEDRAYRYFLNILEPDLLVSVKEPSIITPAQTEAALKRLVDKSDPLWKGFMKLVDKIPAGPVLAPISDRRKAYVDNDDFSNDFAEGD